MFQTNIQKVTQEYFQPTGKTPPNDFLNTLHLRISKLQK